MRIVLDTNVLISGLLKPLSIPGQIYSTWVEKRLRLLVSPMMLQEYKRILDQPKFKFSRHQTDYVKTLIEHETIRIQDIPLDRVIPDPDDLVFLAAAYHGKADALVTGNLKDFPSHACRPVKIVSPAEFLKNFK